MSDARTQLVYDVPTRLFHWLFAGLFVTAYVIANVAEDSPAFPYHMLAGILLGCLVLLRLVWGVVGTRYARFSSFELHPMQLVAYFKGMIGGGGRKWAGHNPASSWAALILLALAAGLGITGILMTDSGNRETYEDLHELLANAFLAVALLHIAGAALHGLKHRDGFARSMVDGRKQAVPETNPIPHSRPVVGLALLALISTSGVFLVQHYDPATQTISAFGTTLSLGDEEGQAHEEEEDED